MLEVNVNPFRDALFQEEFCFPDPFEAESIVGEDPFPFSDALWEEQEAESPAMESSPEEKEFEYDLDEESDIDPEEYKEFYEQWNMSDGFDVNFVPHGVCGGPYIAHNLEDIKKINEDMRQPAYDFANFAINDYNKHAESKLEFVELVKFNLESLGGDMYYLTFEAKDRDGLVSVYQAKVWYEYIDDKKTEVLIFREKPSEYQRSKGVEKKHGCGKGCGCVGCSS